MKKLFCLFVFVFAIATIVVAGDKKNQLNGTWKIQGFTIINNGNKTDFDLSKGSQIKMWSDKHFIFVGIYNEGNQAQNNFGGGTYTLDGNHYTERIDYFTVPANIGNSVRILLEFKNDTLIQIYPADADWKVDKNNYQIEKYVKIDD